MAWEQLGAAELGAKHEAAAFKKIKPGMKVLFYFNAAYAWPYTSYNQDFTRQRIEAHPELKEFLIIHPKTGKLADRYGAFCFDVLNPDFRDWWVETVAKGVGTPAAMGPSLIRCTVLLLSAQIRGRRLKRPWVR